MPITAAQTSVTCRSANRKLFDEPDLENEKTAEERRKALPFLFNAHNLPFRDRFQEFRHVGRLLVRAHLGWNSYFNWKQVINHVGGVVLVMLVRLKVAIGIFCT